MVQSYLQEHLPESTEQVRQAIVAELEPVFGRPLTVDHLRSFPGLSELAASIQKQEEEEEDDATKPTTSVEIPLLVQDAHGSRMRSLTWKNPVRFSLLQALKDDPMTEDLLEASCGGNSSCSSCHVLLDGPSNAQLLLQQPQQSSSSSAPQEACVVSLTPIQEAEQDMLDYAAEYDKTKSRLACQVRVNIIYSRMEDNNWDGTTTRRKIVTTMPITVTIPSTVNDLWK